jgi:hypothetical protein
VVVVLLIAAATEAGDEPLVVRVAVLAVPGLLLIRGRPAAGSGPAGPGHVLGIAVTLGVGIGRTGVAVLVAVGVGAVGVAVLVGVRVTAAAVAVATVEFVVIRFAVRASAAP